MPFKLLDGGPEFERDTKIAFSHYALSGRCLPVEEAPTYEQAIVNMFREAKGILEVGAKLKDEMFIARHEYFHQSASLRMRRELRVVPASSPAKAYLTKQAEGRVLRALDELWLAQEKYKAWAATYGDI